MAKRKRYLKVYQKSTKKKKAFFVLKISGFCFLVFGFFLLFLFVYYARDLPRPEKFTERYFITPTKIYDRSGKILLYQIYGEEKREIISLAEVPASLKEAVIVAEDNNFYHHFGLDFKAIIRAILADLKLKKPVQGASTISQQLIRSSFLTREKTLERKIKEIILTLELERRYSKDQILEFYLNQIPLGQNAYGVEAASQAYFQKSAKDLTLAEAVLLASLIRAPSYLSPYGEKKDELLARKDYILERMAKLGYISQEEKENAKKEELKFVKIGKKILAPNFVLSVQNYLVEKYGEDFLRERGLRVYTTLDFKLQELAEEIVKKIAKRNEDYRVFNASLVALDPKTGQVLALVGSKDFWGDPYPKDCQEGKDCLFEPMFNIATQGERQPGSAFKPFAYALAFQKGFTSETVLWDAQTNFGVWGVKPYIPENYDGKFRGPVTFRQALAQSINVPSVKVLYLAGLAQTIELAKTLGITTLKKPSSFYGLSLVLGGGEVRLLDMVSAYGVFSQDGKQVPPVFILRIEDSQGNILEERKVTQKRVLSSQVARLINDILSDNEARSPIFGPRSPLYFENYQVAVKTGTTQNYRDGWTIGYTPSIVVGVWVGNNDNSPLREKPGVFLAAPIFHQFLEKYLVSLPKEDFPKPEKIEVEKPILNGEIDKENPHSILHYLDKDNPRGPAPQNPENDPQYLLWEEGIKNWLESHEFKN